MQAPPRVVRKRFPVWGGVTIVVAGVAVLFAAPYLLLAVIARGNDPDWGGLKGVLEFEKMSGQKLPQGATCLKVHYTEWLDWHYSFIFKGPTPMVFRDPAKEVPNDPYEGLSIAQGEFDDANGGHLALLHPRDLRSASWDAKHVFFKLESIRCDDGYYFYAAVYTT